jgi:hypothetical protein
MGQNGCGQKPCVAAKNCRETDRFSMKFRVRNKYPIIPYFSTK